MLIMPNDRARRLIRYTYIYISIGDKEAASGGGVPQVGQYNPPIFGVVRYVIRKLRLPHVFPSRVLCFGFVSPWVTQTFQVVPQGFFSLLSGQVDKVVRKWLHGH